MKKTLFFPLALLSFIVILKIFAMAGFIVWGPVGLGPDEAQYWTWSRFLDWGYYSKPPGIAWEIWLGTQLFGNTELGVRFGAILISAALSFGVYQLSRAANLTEWQAFSAALIMTLTPLGLLSSLFATTDGGFVLFWVLTCIPLVYAIERRESPNYLLIGLFIMFGALFKWPIYYLWLLIFISMAFYPNLRSRNIFWGILVSLFGLLPSLVWNASRGWPTFKHVWFTNITGGLRETKHQSLFHGNPLEFLGAQAGLISPVLFVLLVISGFYLFTKFKKIPSGVRLLGLICFLVLLGNLGMALFQHMQGNWMVYAYPTGFVYLAWFLSEKTWGKLWLTIGLITSVVLSAFAMSIPTIQQKSLLKEYPIPFAANLFRECLGWHRLTNILNNIGYDSQKNFLFADRYQETSLLSFYGPNQKRAYFLNLRGIRKNQFSFWPGMEKEQLGNTGFFVLAGVGSNVEEKLKKASEYYQKVLQDYFEDVEIKGVFSLFESYGVSKKSILIIEGKNYNGKLPPETNLY